jgi:hypothetical protein
MRVRIFSGDQYHTAHERIAAYRIIDQLRSFAHNDETLALFQNVRLDTIESKDGGGNDRVFRQCEPDLIVVKRSGIIVVEMKHWSGTIQWPENVNDKRDPWFDLSSGTPLELCEGNRSPVAQLWHNRSTFVAHLNAIASSLPSEAARTSFFAATSSCLLFTNDDITFASARPSFWRGTSLCTLSERPGATLFDATIAAATTKRRDHRTDQRHLIELTDEDVDFLAAHFKLDETRDDSRTSEETVQSPQPHAQTLRARLASLADTKRQYVERAAPLPGTELVPRQLRLLHFYQELVDQNAQATTDLPLTSQKPSTYLSIEGFSLSDVLDLDGLLIPANTLPTTWGASEELTLGIILQGQSHQQKLTGVPLITLPMEMRLADSVDDVAMRCIRVTDITNLNISLEQLKRIKPFDVMAEGEVEKYLQQVEQLNSIEAQVATLMETMFNVNDIPSFGALPKSPMELAFSAVIYQPKSVFNENLRKELADIDAKWQLRLREGMQPDDLAWKFLSIPNGDSSSSTWKPRKASILPLNYEQSLAAAMIYDDNVKVGIVSGPPGTGKSQLICNVLAEAHVQDKTILFASRNNAAVDVVTSRVNNEIFKLPIVIGLGSNERVKRTVATLASIGSGGTITSDELNRLQREAQQSISVTNAKLIELEKAFRDFQGDMHEELSLSIAIDDCITRCSAGYALTGCDASELDLAEKDFNTWKKAINSHIEILKYSRTWLRRLHASFEGWVGAYAVFNTKRFHEDADFYYQRHIADELSSTTSRIIEPLIHEPNRSEDCDTLIELVSLLKQRIETRQRLSGKSEDRFLQQWQELENQRIQPSRSYILARARNTIGANNATWSRGLDSSAPLTYQAIRGMRTLSTTSLSVRRKVDLSTRFDIVLIDEASQANIWEMLPLLYRANRSIIIGDEKQLQPINDFPEHIVLAAMNRHLLNNEVFAPWVSMSSSILTLAQHQLRDLTTNEIMLRDHHRCHRNIIGFSNAEFYNNQLRINTPIVTDSNAQGAFWYETSGIERDRVNVEESQAVVKAVKRLFDQGFTHEQIGVVTPFTHQKHRIDSDLRKENMLYGNNGSIHVDTAHGFQGSERDAMIYSLVVTKDTHEGRKRWANSDPAAAHLINVAVTRARRVLVVVGSKDGTSGYTRRLHEWIQRHSNAN